MMGLRRHHPTSEREASFRAMWIIAGSLFTLSGLCLTLLFTSRGDREDGLSPEADPKRNPLYTTADDAAAPAKAVSSSETVVSFMPRADALLAPPGQEKALVVPVSRVVANGLRMVAQHAAQTKAR